MQTIEYKTIDKSKWPRGEWDNEPDKRQWQDEATGLPCLIVRNGLGGNLCGYVGIPVGHPLHGKDYGDLYDEHEIDVHGGLTFADACGHGADESKGICHKPGEGEPDNVWWFGFDCAHSGDLSPAYNREGRYGGYGESYRTISYVARECESLAKQLAAIK